MNYIKLLNAAFEKFYFDDRLNPSHISLYMALFQDWNSSRFARQFYINRKEIMCASKIGSNSTYHRCIRNLDSWNYLSYFPSNNPFKGSKISMFIFNQTDNSDSEKYDPILEQLAEHYHPKTIPQTYHNRSVNEQVVDQHPPNGGQALVSYKNNIKQENFIKQPKDCQVVVNFFKKNNFKTVDAEKFYAHYAERNWQTGDGSDIRDWRAVANNWMDRTAVLETENISKGAQPFQIQDNLRTRKMKDYDQPL